MWVSHLEPDALMEQTSEISGLPLIAPRPKGLFAAQDAASKRERRATPRLAVELECEERAGGSRLFRITTDLSTFGLSTRHGHPHPRGTRLKLALHLPDEAGTPVEVDAVVVGTFDDGGGMRLAFRRPSVEAARRIHKYLSTRV